MAVVSFDTLAFVERLESAGMAKPQAAVVAKAIHEVAFEQLVTKNDLALTANQLRLELRELEQRLTIRMGGMAAATITILGALIAFHR